MLIIIYFFKEHKHQAVRALSWGDQLKAILTEKAEIYLITQVVLFSKVCTGLVKDLCFFFKLFTTNNTSKIRKLVTIDALSCCYTFCSIFIYYNCYIHHKFSVYGHTMWKAPVPVRSPKLNHIGPGKYLVGRPPRKTRCCRLFEILLIVFFLNPQIDSYFFEKIKFAAKRTTVYNKNMTMMLEHIFWTWNFLKC